MAKARKQYKTWDDIAPVREASQRLADIKADIARNEQEQAAAQDESIDAQALRQGVADDYRQTAMLAPVQDLAKRRADILKRLADERETLAIAKKDQTKELKKLKQVHKQALLDERRPELEKINIDLIEGLKLLADRLDRKHQFTAGLVKDNLETRLGPPAIPFEVTTLRRRAAKLEKEFGDG